MAKKRQKSNQSGVYWQKRRRKWSVKIMCEGILMFWGYYEHQIQAEKRAKEIREIFPKNTPWGLLKLRGAWSEYH